MTLVKAVGPNAAARKYDLLSALMCYALGQHKSVQRRVMRLMVLITARYNWAGDELRMGQRQIAKLWSVDERTVKREMSKLRASGWLVLKQQGARGRVSVYGLGISQILVDTRPDWSKVGDDFVMRMAPEQVPSAETNVVPMRRAGVEPQRDGVWGRALVRLREIDPATCANWFDSLIDVSEAQDGSVLMAPSRFHARFVETTHKSLLLAALRAEGGYKGGFEVAY